MAPSPDDGGLGRARSALRALNLSDQLLEITDVGGLPYDTVRPILMKIDNAAQLHAIEQNCPHIAEWDEECWRRLIKKHYPVLDSQHGTVPRNPASWHKVYAKYAKITAEAKAEAEAKLRAAFAGINKKKQESQSTIENIRSLPRPPRDVRTVGRKEAQGRRGGSNDTGELRWTAGSRTKTTSGASVMRKVKREAAEVAARNKLMTPNGQLLVRQGQIKRAPQGMVHEQAVKRNPALKIRPQVARRPEDEEHDRAMREREARLLKLKAKGASILEDSDVDDDETNDYFGGGSRGGALTVDHLEDLFDDEPAKPQRPQKAALPGKRLLSNAHGTSAPSKVYRASGATSSSSSNRPSNTNRSDAKPVNRSPPSKPAYIPNSPPKSASTTVTSPEPKRMPMKRKAVDVFMKPKAKTQRR
jgi:elongin-A